MRHRADRRDHHGDHGDAPTATALAEPGSRSRQDPHAAPGAAAVDARAAGAGGRTEGRRAAPVGQADTGASGDPADDPRPGRAPTPKLLLPVPSVAARPIPPSGFGSVPVASPIPVRILEEEKKEEEAVESAQNNFAAYRPEQPANIVGPGLAVVLLVLGAGGAAAGLRRRGARGTVAYARAEIRRDPRRW